MIGFLGCTLLMLKAPVYEGTAVHHGFGPSQQRTLVHYRITRHSGQVLAAEHAAGMRGN